MLAGVKVTALVNAPLTASASSFLPEVGSENVPGGCQNSARPAPSVPKEAGKDCGKGRNTRCRMHESAIQSEHDRSMGSC